MPKLFDILKDTGIPFAMYRWESKPSAPYGLLSIERGSDVVASDVMIVAQAINGSIDLFVSDPATSWPQRIQDAINGRVAWTLNSVQYEEDTRLIHYEWLYEAVSLSAIN